jgi:hypothetical protein
MILEAPVGMDVDHINHDGLDNRRCNLRLCEHSQNIWHGTDTPWSETGFWGVRRIGATNRWAASLCVNYKQNHLGTYATPEAAARAYDVAARKYHGEFAKQNFPAAIEEETPCQAQ